MRKIEQQMIQAIKDNTNWTSANTTVTLEDGISKVYLHGNLIAEIDEDSMKLYDGGYQSKTTKSRLNALLNAFGYTCGTRNEQVFQRIGLGLFVSLMKHSTKCKPLSSLQECVLHD